MAKSCKYFSCQFKSCQSDGLPGIQYFRILLTRSKAGVKNVKTKLRFNNSYVKSLKCVANNLQQENFLKNIMLITISTTFLQHFKVHLKSRLESRSQVNIEHDRAPRSTIFGWIDNIIQCQV